MEGGQKRKREEVIKKFLLSRTNGVFCVGSLPRLGDNRADTYCTTKLFSCVKGNLQKRTIDSAVPVLLFRPSVPPSVDFHPSFLESLLPHHLPAELNPLSVYSTPHE
ncbi:hypothetical protein FQN60_018460 [Etheostoma spectabile]|uniref:Uncharacterized protein n=1 Tax=Etheostoma spectabile TaxID=54343 RepID=A0A5J5DI23_9PERO|nr:hypothetical protein FQN60_018460 [Etheostoma spectabile]